MLDITPHNLLKEVQSAERLTTAILNGSRGLIRDYQGRHHRDDQTPDFRVDWPGGPTGGP